MKYNLNQCLKHFKRIFSIYKVIRYQNFYKNIFSLKLLLHLYKLSSIKYLLKSNLIDSILISEKYKKEILRKKNQWKGKTVICIGNGPSIKNTRLDLLNNEYVIGTNRAYLLLNEIKPKHFELIIQDNTRINEISNDLIEFKGSILISNHECNKYNENIMKLLKNKENIIYYHPKLKLNLNHSEISSNFDNGFSENPINGIYMGHSVIFSAIQWAYFYGANKIICIGIDMDYTTTASFVSGVKNIWSDFSYETHCMDMFVYINKFLTSKGIELINSTPGGKVNEIKRMSLEDALKV